MAIKRKKWRKPLTEEQKAERRERLKKAREAKAPPKYVTVHPSVRELPDDDTLSLKNVRGWIKKNKEERQRLRTMLKYNKGDKKTNSECLRSEAYVQNLETYVRTGEWLDLFYGPDKQYKIKYKCLNMAYEADGTPKRTIDTWYSDIGWYTQKMYDAARK